MKPQQSILFFCCCSFSSSDQIIIIIITPLPEGTFPGTRLTNQMKTSTCAVQVVESLHRVHAGIWFGCVWCALGTANASTVAGGLECAQKPSASTPARPQNKACVKFNSRWTVPTGSASSSAAPASVLNYKNDGGLRLVRFFPPAPLPSNLEKQ